MACGRRSRRLRPCKNKEQRTENKRITLFFVLCSRFYTLMADAGGSNDRDDDGCLLDQVAHGDLRALERLFGRYQRPIYQLALGVTGDTQTAEEVLQDTFYRLYTHAARLDGSQPLLPWLY